jgi:hypothetical protein
MVMDVDAEGFLRCLRHCPPIRQQGSCAQSCESAKKPPPRAGNRSRMDMVRMVAGKYLRLIAQFQLHDLLPVFCLKSYPAAVADETVLHLKVVGAQWLK